MGLYGNLSYSSSVKRPILALAVLNSGRTVTSFAVLQPMTGDFYRIVMAFGSFCREVPSLYSIYRFVHCDLFKYSFPSTVTYLSEQPGILHVCVTHLLSDAQMSSHTTLHNSSVFKCLPLHEYLHFMSVSANLPLL